MKIVETGSRLRVYSNDLIVNDSIKTGIYNVGFNPMQGFYLEKQGNIEIKDPKIYGVHLSKVDKVFRTLKLFNRNLGVMLSGDKGMGKSLFAKLLSIRANEINMPVLLVNEYNEGIAEFLNSIEQEIVVVFDEFEKTFRATENKNPQTELLTLIDGFGSGKKMFIITCNSTHNVSDFFVNRTGRFHYHFRFDYPIPQEITEYMVDNLNSVDLHTHISDVISLSMKVSINYDTLRSIVFELNNGESFVDTIQDLNIPKGEKTACEIILKLNKSTKEIENTMSLDLFSKNIDIVFYGNEKYYSATIEKSKIKVDVENGNMIAENVKVKVDDDGVISEDTAQYIVIKRRGMSQYKFCV